MDNKVAQPEASPVGNAQHLQAAPEMMIRRGIGCQIERSGEETLERVTLGQFIQQMETNGLFKEGAYRDVMDSKMTNAEIKDLIVSTIDIVISKIDAEEVPKVIIPLAKTFSISPDFEPSFDEARLLFAPGSLRSFEVCCTKCGEQGCTPSKHADYLPENQCSIFRCPS
jgi:hypothetical protein